MMNKRGRVATNWRNEVIEKLKRMLQCSTKMPPRNALPDQLNIFKDSSALHFPRSDLGTASMIIDFVSADVELIHDVLPIHKAHVSHLGRFAL